MRLARRCSIFNPINTVMEEPSFQWSELEGTEKEQIHVIAYDLIIAHVEAFHPELMELFYQEEEKRIAEGRDNNPVMPMISGLTTEMNLDKIVIDARSMLGLNHNEYMRKRANYLEYLRGLNQSW
jgi:hypothetical protein